MHSMSSSRVRYVLDNPWRFARQVLAGFRANQGLLLAGSVAYHTLLSIVPMFALMLVMLSQIRPPQELLDTLREYLVLLTPGQAEVGAQVIAEYERIGTRPHAPHGLQT